MFTTPFAFMAAPAGGGFSPIDIPDLVRWWDSTVGVATSGGYVTTWTDQIVSAVATATSSTNFTIGDTLNGISGITSPPTNSQRFDIPSVLTLTALTIFGVLKRTGTNNPQYFLGASASQGIGAAYDGGSGYKPFIYDGPSGMIFEGGSNTINTPYYTTWGLSTSTGFINQNGVQVATNSGNPNPQLIYSIFENSNAGFRTLQGTIWEILIYNRVLTGGEITQVQNYLASKYAL